MKVLVGCEESQVVTKAFRDKGHEAYSCDMVETRGNPDWHIQGDVMDNLDGWDLIILHPPCDYLALCGNRWYSKTLLRDNAIIWTRALWDIAISKCSMVALENPASVIFKELGVKAQYIQPYQFGHMEQKKTGLALYGLSPLIETLNVYDEMMKLSKKDRERVFHMPPGPNRKRDRSKTYQGIADAMADQWG